MTEKRSLNMESNYKEKYEAIVFFLYHEYSASLCTFQGLLQIVENTDDPYVEHFKTEFKKYQQRAQVIATLMEEIRPE